jgi:hypothetical protein
MSAELATSGAPCDAGCPSSGLDARVSHWVFDAWPGQISARNGEGRLLMAISVNPLFGPRLAAAFSSPAPGRAAVAEHWRGVGDRPQQSPWLAPGRTSGEPGGWAAAQRHR